MKIKISKKIIYRILLGLLIVFIAIQFIAVEKTNPPVTGELNFPKEIKSVMQRSCYDCHSNETVWPWYSHIAPVSWLVSKDVVKGRDELNFSEWDKYSDKRRAKKIKEIWEEIEKGEMPMSIYIPLHPDAVLTAEDKELIKKWVNDFNAPANPVINNQMD